MNETRGLALPRGMPFINDVRGLAEEWDNFCSMIFQGFFRGGELIGI
jgi:hypothetical protein